MKLLAACCLGLSPVLAIAAAPMGDAAPREIMGRMLEPTPILTDLEELVDGIGGRPSGSPALDGAVAWGIDKFRAAGLENVHVESYAVPTLWIPGQESGELLQPASHPLHIAALPFSAGTGPSGLVAEVVSVGHGSATDFAKVHDRLRGHWALVETETMRSNDDLDNEYLMAPPIFSAARRAGAIGVLWTSTRPGRLLYRHPIGFDGKIDPLPGAMIDREDALLIVRLVASAHPVAVKITTTPNIVVGARLGNVVGELRGSTKPGEYVVLGAHLDSWDLGQGALDNGCNSVLVIDAARQIAAVAARRRPARTIRFVLFTGEEAGFLGSRAYVRVHRAELDQTAAMITFDSGTGRTTGFSTGGRADVVSAADAALAPAAGLGPFNQTTDAFVGTDNYDYLVEGVPNFVANQNVDSYLPTYHSSADTLDKVDGRELKLNAAIAAVFTWDLADAPERPAKRQSRSEIERLVKETGLDDKMRAFGLWNEFVSGTRGRLSETRPLK